MEYYIERNITIKFSYHCSCIFDDLSKFSTYASCFQVKINRNMCFWAKLYWLLRWLKARRGNFV